MAKTKRGTPALAALDKAGIAHTTYAYDFEATPGSIGLAAAQALGVAPERLLKTLAVALDSGELVVAILAVDRELDLKALAKAAGSKRAALADLTQAERATGYVKGGISPFGQKKRHRTFLDADAAKHATILVNAGKRGLQVELKPEDLVCGLGAVTAVLT